MIRIDILKFNGANLIKKGCKVNVKTYLIYSEVPKNDNFFSLCVSESAAYEIEVIDENGKRFKTSVQAHTPKITKGYSVKQCSVYGEVIENIENSTLIIDRVNLNF